MKEENLEDLKKEIEDLKQRLKDKDSIIDCYRRETANLKSYLDAINITIRAYRKNIL